MAKTIDPKYHVNAEPMVRTGLVAGMAVIEDDVYDETRCCASDCMMWREYRGNGWCGLAGPITTSDGHG